MESLQSLLNNTPGKVLSSILIIILLSLLRAILVRNINRYIEDIRSRYTWRQTVSYIISVVGVLLLILIWLQWVQSIITMLSLIAAAITVASKELILNFISHGVIVWRRLFDVGDRIQIGANIGDVIEIGPAYFAIAEVGNWVNADEPTGRVIKVPNSAVLTQPLANYTRGLALIWNELRVELVVGSDWQKAKQIAEEIARQHTYKFSKKELAEIRSEGEEIIFLKTEPAVYVQWKEGKIALTIRYACKFHKRRYTEQQIWETLMKRFEEEDIQLFAMK